MNCPRCGQVWCCPCNACRERGKKGDVPWIREGKNNEKCPKCGLSKSMDWWEDLELQIYLDKPEVEWLVWKTGGTPDQTIIATSSPRDNPDGIICHMDKVNCENEARLIAAAPDLLKVAKTLDINWLTVEHWLEQKDYESLKGAFSEWKTMLRKAYAKAKNPEEPL